MLQKQATLNAVQAVLQDGKGKRKFQQSVDLAVNFQDVDFKKPENRLNIDVVLPFPTGAFRVAIFADGTLANDARKLPDLIVISGDQIPVYVADKKKQKELLQFTLLAEPKLMAVVGKQLGQLLGAKGKLPKPVMPGMNLTELVDRTRRSVNLKSKGKFLPVVHCKVGTEAMSPEQITENVLAILESVEKKYSDSQVKSVLVKCTMGKPVKVS